MKAISNGSKCPVFFVEKLKQSWSCILAYKAGALAAARPAARMLTWKRRCEQGIRAQAPPSRSSSSRATLSIGRWVPPVGSADAVSFLPVVHELHCDPLTHTLRAPHNFRDGNQRLQWKCLLCLFSASFSSLIKQETELNLSKVYSDFLFPDRLTAPAWKPTIRTAGSPSHPGHVL